MTLYHYALVAEEGFFLTVIMNSPFSDRVVFNDDGRTKTLTFTKPFVHSHPPIFTIDDIDLITNSNCFFARKFDERVDSSIIDYYYNRIMRNSTKHTTNSFT